MPIRAVVLDFDGTILDSFRNSNLGKVAKLRGRAMPENLTFKDFFGKTAKQIIQTCWPDENVEEFHELWEETDRTNPAPLINGAIEVLNFLKKNLAITGILTQRRSNSLLPMLGYYNLLALFQLELLQTIDNWPHTKPNPNAFENILKILESNHGIMKRNILYVGDTSDDYRCASGAGIRFVGVETGPLNKLSWLNLGLKLENIIRSIADLPEWIEKYNKNQ